jgi:hypothetical protein
VIKRDPFSEVEITLEGDAAAALGGAGRKLGHAVNALADFDSAGLSEPKERTALLHAAAYALWAYVVQKELIGITDNSKVNEVYGVKPEVWRLMGVVCHDEVS